MDDLYNNKFTITDNNFVNIIDNNINFDDKIIEKLLKKYKALMLQNTHIDLLHKLPKYITKLVLYYLNDEEENYINIQSLPIELKELYIIIDSNEFNFTLENLPIGLEILIIESETFNKPIDNLPIGLKVLIINSKTFNHTIDNLPPNLEYFKINN